MKKVLSLVCGAMLTGMPLFAQESQVKNNWQNGSLEQDGVYGAEIDRALDFLKGKKAKHRPVVALIGAGIDLEHEALKDNLWTNPKEKADGKDNDKNGLVDDIHGWNFIGGKDGSVMERSMMEGDREWLRLKDKYADLIFDGKDFYKYENGNRVKVDPPANKDEYDYFMQILRNRDSHLASTYAGYVFANENCRYGKMFFDRMRQMFPGKEKYSYDDFKAANPVESIDIKRDSLEAIAYSMISMHMGIYEGMLKQRGKKLDDLSFFFDYYENGKNIAKAKDNWEKAKNASGDDGRREIVGDDPYDINDRVYGNNVHLLSNSTGGTLAAGVIAGKRGVEGRNNPICENAEIMTLNVINTAGEPCLKDMALAIRYAVEHGADVILCGLRQTVYPAAQRAWVEESLKLAEEKGVLVIFTVTEYSVDLGEYTFYPNRDMTTPGLTNFMVVAPSDEKGNPFLKSDFGNEEVDLFAPGCNVFSTYMGDIYRAGSGAFVSGAVVAGVAALIKAYYPSLTGSQIRALLNENVTSREGVEVEKMFYVNGDLKQDVYLFDELCLSKGIVNAYKAVVAADALAKQGGGVRR